MHFSNSCLRSIFWIGIAASGLAALLACVFLSLQAARKRSSQEELAFLTLWRPLLLGSFHSAVPAALPLLESVHRLHFMKLWNQLMRDSNGDAANRLRAIAYAVGCAPFCRRYLRNGNRIERLLATLTLGQLHDEAAWDALVNQSMADDHLTSLHAFQALVRIDADAAAQQLTLLMLARRDWPVAQLASILQPAQSAFLHPLIETMQDTRAAHMPRTLRLVEALRFALPQASIRQLLDTTDSKEVLIGTLRIINDAGLLPQARTYLKHEDWRVRVQAAKLLGRIGEHADVNRLIPLLADAEWWVRYRAAKALAGMPFFSRAELELLRNNLSDRFARDMLGQVLAERNAS
ncbi:MAG TPA: HEAT repeat domain-containing protein [Oxalicibacterium sp.]|nr:HEAT repeat domain-containing protein [Oxalicibacterium sp.]